MTAVRCIPSEADWYVHVVWGSSYCPDHGSKCRRPGCDLRHGTSTGESDMYFTGDSPTLGQRNAMVPEDCYKIKSTVQPCRKGR